MVTETQPTPGDGGRIFGRGTGTLCLSHIEDEALVERLRAHVDESECSLCDRSGGPLDEPFAVTFDDLMEIVEETIHHFYVDANSALPWDGGFQGPQTDVWEVVDDVVSGAVADDVVDRVLEGIISTIGYDITWTPDTADADLNVLDYLWDEFARTTKYESRLVIAGGRPGDPPSRLAASLEQFVQYASDSLQLVEEIPAGTKFFRGRLCEDPTTIKKTCGELGPAPKNKAAVNQMSPAGIALFYASADPETAIAEIAVHGGEPLAVVGQFTNTRSLRVLNFVRTPPAISPFDLGRRDHARLGRFLEHFVSLITEPVIPDGRQHIEYAPTQVLTEYLRWVPDPKLDGIALPARRLVVVHMSCFTDRKTSQRWVRRIPLRLSAFLASTTGSRRSCCTRTM